MVAALPSPNPIPSVRSVSPWPSPQGNWIPISSASVLSVYSVVRILRGLFTLRSSRLCGLA